MIVDIVSQKAMNCKDLKGKNAIFSANFAYRTKKERSPALLVL